MAVDFACAQNSKEPALVLTTDAQKLKYATFGNSDQLKWAPLKKGVNIYGTTDRCQWEQVPDSLLGVRFLVLPHHSGVLNFKVQSDGLVFMATSTRWYDSGDWKDEVLLEKDLRRKGWRRLRAIKKLSNTDTGEIVVFYRHGKSG